MIMLQQLTVVIRILSVALLANASVSFATTKTQEEPKNWEFSNGYLIDHSTGDLYNSDDQGTVREKSAALVLGNATINAAVNLPATILGRFFQGVGRLVTAKDRSDAKEGFKGMAVGLTAPLIWLGMEGAAVVGIFNPYFGRKYYQRLEKHMAFRLAPCFEPIGHIENSKQDGELARKDHDQHLLRLDINGKRW